MDDYSQEAIEERDPAFALPAEEDEATTVLAQAPLSCRDRRTWRNMILAWPILAALHYGDPDS